MNALVTGATGFLGKQLALRLNSLSANVTGMGRNPIVGQQLLAENIKFLQIDLRDKDAVIAACRGQDYVFHCGALSSPWGQDRDFYDTNVLGTQNIIIGCQTYGVKRLIYVSTASVYFDFVDRLNIPEHAPLPTPVNAYAKSKQLAEQEIDRAYQSGLPIISIRPRGIFGIGDPSILPRLIRANNRTGIPLINAGTASIDVTYIDNVVDALLLCQSAPHTLLGRTFNITNGSPICVADLLVQLFSRLGDPCRLRPISYPTVDRIAAVMEFISNSFLGGKEPILTRYTVGLLAFSQTLDITAAIQELGYQPRISIESGLDIFAKWWKAH